MGAPGAIGVGVQARVTPLELLALGLSVVPSGAGPSGKAPLVLWADYQQRRPTEAEVLAWGENLQPKLWGVVTGAISGVVAVDTDTPEARGVMGDLEPHVLTPRGGAHFYFRHPGKRVKTDAGLLPGLDVRGDGGFANILGPGYTIARLPTPDTVYPWERLPERVRGALEASATARAKVVKVVSEGQPIPETQRNATLASYAGTMRRRGMPHEAIEAALLEVNRRQCQPPLSEIEVEKIAKSIAHYPPQPNRVLAQLVPVASNGVPWPPPLEADALYGLAGDVVTTILPHTEADDAALLINFLEAFGSAVGRGPHAVAEADRHGCNINAVIVGETAKGRKGSSWGHVRALFARADPVWAGAHVSGGLSSGEGLIWAVRDPTESTTPIKDKGRPTGEYETFTDDVGVIDKRLLVVESEFASPLRVMERNGSTLSPTIRQAWDTGDLRTLTKNSPAKATGAHISIVGHVTRGELLRYLNDTEMGNGFANRFLWVCTQRARVLPESGGEVNYGPLVERLHSALERGRSMGRLQRDDMARQLWAEVYPELSEGKPGLFGAVTARAEAQVLRLSLLYAVLDGADAIGPAHLKAALAVWEYCEESARFIFGDATGDPVGDQILRALRLSGELTRTAIYSGLFGRNTSAARIEHALGTLQAAGLAHCEMRPPSDAGGRPAEVWYG
jgi:hypothetical protein